jgi:YCII-related domain
MGSAPERRAEAALCRVRGRLRGDQHDARRAVGLPENATTVRVQDGKTLTTDGPFVELKEAVGGYYVVEADDLTPRRGPRPPPSRHARTPTGPWPSKDRPGGEILMFGSRTLWNDLLGTGRRPPAWMLRSRYPRS